ncbi:MAG: nickel-dependent hydrogenase large subunit [Rhodocyclaceae bacterium]
MAMPEVEIGWLGWTRSGMITEGSLGLEVVWDGKQLTGARVRSGRPLLASRVLEGASARHAIGLVPRLFALCGRAQSVAAAAALEAASGECARDEPRGAREAMLAVECAHEHLWRLLVDLPGLLGQPARLGAFGAIRRRLQDAQRRLVSPSAWWGDADGFPRPEAWRSLAGEVSDFLAAELLGTDCARFLRLCGGGEAERWMRSGAAAAELLGGLWDRPAGRSDVASLRLPEEDVLAGEIAPAMQASDAFLAAPVLGGAPAHTGALARQAARIAGTAAARGATVGVRLLARVVDLAALPQRLCASCEGEPVEPWLRSLPLPGGRGVAAVETARGVLIHLVELAGERVARYRILAPTEWNFHPEGAFVRGLEATPARDEGEARRSAALLAHALDPCVACEIAVRHA